MILFHYSQSQTCPRTIGIPMGRHKRCGPRERPKGRLVLLGADDQGHDREPGHGRQAERPPQAQVQRAVPRRHHEPDQQHHPRPGAQEGKRLQTGGESQFQVKKVQYNQVLSIFIHSGHSGSGAQEGKRLQTG